MIQSPNWQHAVDIISLAPPNPVSESIRAELESTRAAFHALLGSLTQQDLQRRSNNPGWTNGEILFHMTFAFMLLIPFRPIHWFFGVLPKSVSRLFARLLNSGTSIFNWINALGARGGGRIYTHERIGKKYDAVHASILRTLDSISEKEWRRGMHYPTKWDALFNEYMTLEDVFRYPTRHFNFHLNQISR